MNAGRELDRLIDKILFNGKVDAVGIPRYSSSIAAAWIVSTAMVEKGYCCFKLYGDYNYQFTASFKHEYHHEQEFSENADTAPHAICLAALKAVTALKAIEGDK